MRFEETLRIGSIVVPFCGSYWGSFKVIPKRNYYGAYGYTLAPVSGLFWENWGLTLTLQGLIFSNSDAKDKLSESFGPEVPSRIRYTLTTVSGSQCFPVGMRLDASECFRT